MTRSRFLCAFAAIGLLTIATPAAAAPAEDVDSAITQRLAETATPGAAWAALDGEEVVHTGQYGEDGNGKAVDSRTQFLWGSLAKPITATAILRLQEDEVLDITDPVTEHLPDFAPQWKGDTARPTIAQLLTHTSGLAAGFGDEVTDRADSRPDAVGQVAAELNNVELSAAPGSEYQYASSDYLLLGAVIEAVTGQHYSEYVSQEIFAPLGMDSAFASQDDADALPPGHRQAFGTPVAFDGPVDNSGAPYGYIGGDLTDLTHFASAHLNADNPVLTPESTALAHEAHVASNTGHYGYGWSLSELPGTDEPIVWHSGATPGYQSMLVMLPEHDKAVVLTQNTYSLDRDSQLLDAAYDAAATLIGESPAGGHDRDPMLQLTPWVLAGLAVAVAGLAWWPRVRARSGRAWRIAAWWTMAIAISATLLLAFPVLVAPLPYIWLWVPDLAWSGLALCLAAIGTAIVRTARIRRASGS